MGVYVFFNLIEQHSKFLLHTLQVLHMCTLCDSTGLIEMIVGVFLLNKKNIYCYLKCIVYDKLLKPQQSFRITLYMRQYFICQLSLFT